MARGKSLLLGLLVGGTIGAASTLLSTPTSGKDLRFKIRKQSREWRELLDGLKNEGLRLKNQISDTSKEGIALMKNLTIEMKQSIEQWRKTVEPHQENIHEYIAQIEENLKELEEKVKEKL